MARYIHTVLLTDCESRSFGKENLELSLSLLFAAPEGQATYEWAIRNKDVTVATGQAAANTIGVTELKNYPSPDQTITRYDIRSIDDENLRDQIKIIVRSIDALIEYH